MTWFEIRELVIDDANSIAAIYGQHVMNSTATFEEVPPSVSEMTLRINELLKGNYPALVAMHEGRIIGYAYAGPHKQRSGYRYTVEDSIYVEPAFHGRKIGSGLLSQLIERCTAVQFSQMMAVIGDSRNTASIALHQRFGFRHIGIAAGIGYKFGRPLDVIYMQRELRVQN